MKFVTVFSTLASMASMVHADVQGFDISHYQSSVNFAGAYAGGLRFVYIKATEGTTYQDPKVQSLSSHVSF